MDTIPYVYCKYQNALIAPPPHKIIYSIFREYINEHYKGGSTMNNRGFLTMPNHDIDMERLLNKLKNDGSIKLVAKERTNLSIKMESGVIYGTYDDDNNNISRTLQLAKSIDGLFMNSYLKRAYTYSVPNESFDDKNVQMDPELSENDISKLIGKVTRKLALATIRIRLVSPNNVFTLEIGSTDGMDNQVIIAIRCDSYKKVARIFSGGKLLNGGTPGSLFSLTETPLYLSRKSKDGEMLLKKNPNPFDDVTLSLMKISLQMLYDQIISTDEVPQLMFPKYCDTEIYFIKKSVSNIMGSDRIGFALFQWVNNDAISSLDTVMGEDFNLKIPQILATPNIDQFPLIDFNQNEWDFIGKYVNGKNILCGKTEQPFNIIPYLLEPTYGTTLRYKLEFEDDSIQMMLMSYTLDAKRDTLTTYMVCKISDDITVYNKAIFTNLQEFDVTTSLVEIDTDVVFTNAECLVEDPNSLLDKVVASLFDASDAILLIREMLRVHIILHDRPQRTRVIKCSSRQVNHSNDQKKNHSTKTHEEGFVISRILKTVSDAKSFIARMSEEGICEREYTMESWNRRGYFRHLRSGEAIWIPPTTCTRHCPLSDKELHIKL